jgi:hypothetical protein
MLPRLKLFFKSFGIGKKDPAGNAFFTIAELRKAALCGRCGIPTHFFYTSFA